MSLTDQLLQITASASSESEAERRANVVAQEFMQLRGQELATAQQVDVPALNEQMQAKLLNATDIAAKWKQRDHFSPPSPANTTFLKALAKDIRDLEFDAWGTAI